MSKLRKHLTYANVISTLCLFLLLGGGAAYAADTILSSDIKDGEVKTQDLANSAVNNTKIANSAVNAGKVQDGTLQEVDLKKIPWQNVATSTATEGGPDPCDGTPPATGMFCGALAATTINLHPWQNYGNGYQTARFFRDAAGIVHVEGLVQHPSPGIAFSNFDAVFILPVGFRPASSLDFAVDCKELNNENGNSIVEHGRIDVFSDGKVNYGGFDNCNRNDYISLNGIDFRADQ
jgi:hypothetical protein